MNELIPRAGVDEVAGYRDLAIRLYESAFEKIRAADEAVKEADAAVRRACEGLGSDFHEPRADEVVAFRRAVNLPDPDQYARVARRLTDLRVWASLIERTDLAHLMDKKAKDELRKQMEYVPENVDPRTGALLNAEEIAKGLPPVSVEAVLATLEGFREDAGTIWRRGIANAFAELDRRFRSHDGFKIGNRVILSYAFDDWGSWNYHRHHRDTLIDIERVFLVLDGKAPRAAYGGIVGVVDHERKGGGMGQRQSEHLGDYFKVRIFKNGNAHLWFTRKDLLAKVNLLLAEHYGEVVGDGNTRADQEHAEEAFETAVMRAPAKRFGFYPTPDEVADRIIEEARLYRRDGDPQLRVLEPSAGTGQLSRRIAETGARVDVVEIQAELAWNLGHPCGTVTVRNFLEVTPDPVYDRVVMNPPFDLERDIDHVFHAWKFLKPGGLLVAIVSAGAEFRETKKARAFRELMKTARAEWRDLPAGSFSAAGTNVNTCYVRATKPE